MQGQSALHVGDAAAHVAKVFGIGALQEDGAAGASSAYEEFARVFSVFASAEELTGAARAPGEEGEGNEGEPEQAAEAAELAEKDAKVCAGAAPGSAAPLHATAGSERGMCELIEAPQGS